MYFFYVSAGRVARQAFYPQVPGGIYNPFGQQFGQQSQTFSQSNAQSTSYGQGGGLGLGGLGGGGAGSSASASTSTNVQNTGKLLLKFYNMR